MNFFFLNIFIVSRLIVVDKNNKSYTGIYTEIRICVYHMEDVVGREDNQRSKNNSSSNVICSNYSNMLADQGLHNSSCKF